MNKKLLTILLLAALIFLFYDIGIVDYQSLIGNITTSSHKLLPKRTVMYRFISAVSRMSIFQLPKVRPIILATSLYQGSASLSKGSMPSSQGSTPFSQGSTPLSRGSTSSHRLLASAAPIINSTQKLFSFIPFTRHKGNFFNDWSKACKANVTTEEYDRLFPKNVDKYLFASWSGSGGCDGLANQMWRFAMLYGTGKPFGRMPLSTVYQNCLKSKRRHITEGEHELENLFPIYFSQIKYIKPEDVKNDTFFMKGFAPHCCAIEEPEKLAKRYAISSRKEKYLIVDGHYLQSYKFFANRRTEIRQIFQFGHGICKTVGAYQKELFRNDKAHKFCVHVRLGDFEQQGWATKKDFTELGIVFGFNFLKEKFSNVSIVLMGSEKKFLIDLEINRQQIANVYVPKAMPRGEDMAFGATVCDSLLITASSSTFSWWMAYLMPDNATIFYNSNFKGMPFSRTNFLPEWVPIHLSNGTMAFDY